MSLAKFFKTPAERKRYMLDYSDWLDTSETLSTAIFTVTPTDATPIEVDAYSISSSGTELVFFVNYGTDAVTYTVDVKITTSGGQTKEDQILFLVREL